MKDFFSDGHRVGRVKQEVDLGKAERGGQGEYDQHALYKILKEAIKMFKKRKGKEICLPFVKNTMNSRCGKFQKSLKGKGSEWSPVTRLHFCRQTN